MTPHLTAHDGVTAEEILYVLNGRQTVPLNRLGFLAITGTYTPHRLEPQDWPFTPGEIVVVLHGPEGTREFLGRGRDPYTAWEDAGWCTYECSSFQAALDVSALVTSDRPRGYYDWTDDGLAYMGDQDAAYRQWSGAPDWYVRVANHAGRGHYAAARERGRAGI
ncbi:hypothetical protein ABZ725_14735 [Streptomyces sp. NPDC006872]|uniref:hypothetical protein n=1 Tax=Streptomyces sp. NPDC006872 TaxID=3155720 RepID=UPI0033F61376